MAYTKLRSNPDSMAPGPDSYTIDGTSLEQLKDMRSVVVRWGQWGGAQRAKPGEIDERKRRERPRSAKKQGPEAGEAAGRRGSA